MEIFLLLAVVAAGASGLYVAATLYGRARQVTEVSSPKRSVRSRIKLDTPVAAKLKELRPDWARESGKRELRAQAEFKRVTDLISVCSVRASRLRSRPTRPLT